MNTEAFFFSFSFFLLRKTPFVCGSVAIMVWVMLPCGLTTKILSEKRKKKSVKQVSLLTRSAKIETESCLSPNEVFPGREQCHGSSGMLAVCSNSRSCRLC